MQPARDFLAPQPLDDLVPWSCPRRAQPITASIASVISSDPCRSFGELRRRLHPPQPLQHPGRVDEDRARQPLAQHRPRIRRQEARLDADPRRCPRRSLQMLRRQRRRVGGASALA